MLKAAKTAFNKGDEQGAAEMLAQVQELQEEQGRPATGRARKTQVELTALVGARASQLRAEQAAQQNAPQTETAEASEASNGVSN